MSTTIFLSTSSSQELCQKTQCTRRRRRDLDPEGPAHLNRQDRAGELSQTVIYLQLAVTARLSSQQMCLTFQVSPTDLG